MIPIGDQGWIGYVISFAIFFLFFTLWQKLQLYNWLSHIARNLEQIKKMRDDAFETSVKTVKEVGKPKEDPTPFIRRFMEYALIFPTDLDPAGIIWKLDHLLDVRDARFQHEIQAIAPKATQAQLNNLENLLAASADLNLIYKVVRHFYLLGRKTKNFYIVAQLQMQMPLIMQIAEAYAGAVYAFSNGCPVGDGAGALVAAKLMRGCRAYKIAKDMVFSKRSINGRKVIILKGEGPGGNIGKPGDAIRTLIEQHGGNIAMVILVDAQVKFEGEKTGTVTEGIGAAIGGIGTEKYKTEEISSKYKIPLNAVFIKQSIQEAISPIKEEIIKGVDEAVEVVKRIINEKVKKGETVIVAGIGNTIGIGQ